MPTTAFSRHSSRLRQNWNILAESGVWLAALIGGFVTPPPEQLAGVSDSQLVSLSGFVNAVVVGLFIVLIATRRPAQGARFWARMAGAALGVAVVLFFVYREREDAWTCLYDSHRIVIGSTFTIAGARHAELDCKELLEDADGRADFVWTDASIRRNKLLLTSCYVALMPLFAVSILCTIEAGFRLSKSRPKNTAIKATATADRKAPTRKR